MNTALNAAFSGLMLVALLLAGCGAETPPAVEPAAPAAPAASAAQTVPAPEPIVAETAPSASTSPLASAEAPAPVAPVATTSAPPTGPEPREGVDYTRIDPSAPLSPSPGKIEVAEVFAYHCIHCATLQTRITPWKATLPVDVEFRYVPMAHGGSEPFARAFYAAEAMGELDRTHEALFKAIAVDRKLTQGTLEAIADLYADLGVDREALLSTAASFAVNAQIARNQKTVARWAIEGTPTVVVNGRYRAVVTQDRGQDGLFGTVEHLIARERTAAAAGTDGTP